MFGLLISAGSGFFIWMLMQQHTKPDVHLIYVAAAGIFFGALLIMPTIILTTLKQLLAIVGQYIPVTMIGGRRSTDPPAPPEGPS